MPTTLEQLLADYPSHQSTEDALFEKARQDIERSSLANQESLFSRGLGLSTIQGEIERQRGEALSQARRDAFLAAQQAQLSAAAQAAQQQQFQQTLAQRQQEAGASAKYMKNRIAQGDRSMMFQAGGALGGAALQMLGKTFGPEISGGLRHLAGMEPRLDQGMTRMYGQLGAPSAPNIEAPAIESTVAPYSPEIEPGLSIPDELSQVTLPDYGSSPVDLPAYNFGGSDIFGSEDFFGGGLDNLYWDNPEMQQWGDYL